MKISFTFYFLLFAMLTFQGFAQQCTPEENLPDDFIGVFPPPFVEENPDSGIKIPACINEEYDLTLSVFVPNEIEFGVLTLGVQQITLTSVDGLPEGLEVICNRTNCIYPAQEIDCIKVRGVPTANNQPGEYDIFINMRARTNIFPNLEIQFPGIIAPGKYTIQVLEEGSEACRTTTRQRKIANELSLAVSPNPFKDFMNLQLNDGNLLSNNQEYQVELLDISGRVILVEKRIFFGESNPLKIPENVSPGVKILRIKDSSGIVLGQTKVIKIE